jgi:hypothetical protein
LGAKLAWANVGGYVVVKVLTPVKNSTVDAKAGTMVHLIVPPTPYRRLNDEEA